MSTRKQIFTEELQKYLGQEGFVFKKTQNSFIKTSTECTYIIRFTSWADFSQVEVAFDVFIKKIEEIKKKAWQKGYIKHCTVGQRKDIIAKDFFDRVVDWTDDTSTEAKAVLSAQNVYKFYRDFGSIFFTRFSSTEEINRFLNDSSDHYLHLAYNPVHTSFLAVIVAFLCAFPKLDEVLVFYRQQVKNWPVKSWLVDFDILVDYLKKTHPLLSKSSIH